MKTYKIRAISMGNFAPAFYVDAASQEEAEKIAVTKTRLADFPNTKLVILEIKNKKQNGSKRNN
jgi:hypothetical protein